MSQEQLKIKQVKIGLLKASEYNPRKISDREFSNLLSSLREHSLVQPLIANSNPARAEIVIAGHQRLRAAKELGYKTVPVIYLNLDEEHERRLNLKLNRISGEFDTELLLKHFDIETLMEVGFDDSDLASMWNDALDIEDDEFDEEKALEKAADTDIKLGDKFALGKHKLICGDSGDPDVIKRLVDDLKPTMLYTDPIFNIGLDYDKGVSSKTGYGGKTKDKKSDKDYNSFLGKILDNALAVMADDAHVFMYCDQSYIWLLQTLMAEHGLTNKRVCLWIKNNFNMTPQVAFNKAYEPCVYAVRGAPYLSDTHNLTEILNKHIAVGNRSIDDIIDVFDIWLAKRDPAQAYMHPTQKPVTLHEKPLKRCSKPGDVILDVFAGSGSLLSACEQLKRVALLVEIEPQFCQVIVDRYEALTGQKAVKL